MFQNRRFITCGIDADISVLIQSFLWDLIDKFERNIEQDYLQVFKLSVIEKEGKQVQKIIHLQEEPEYIMEYFLDYVGPGVETKVFVIDDEDHSTMLLASEY